MFSLPKNMHEIEKSIGSLKFAVFIISLFTIAMIVGTFFESYYGTDFANRTIYKSYWFMGIQAMMFLSIIFAASLRLPPKKRLYGFYTIHAGLIIIGIGSIVTYLFGVDGQIYLPPNETNRTVVLSKDVLKITYPDEGKQFIYHLPTTAWERTLNIVQGDLEFKKFIPYAEGKVTFIPSVNDHDTVGNHQSSQYYFKNAFASQEMTFTLHPEASSDFTHQLQLGPLKVDYLPVKIANCFKLAIEKSHYFIWNKENNSCHFIGTEAKLKFDSAQQAYYTTMQLPNASNVMQSYLFYPELTPNPIDPQTKKELKSSLVMFNLKKFTSRPHLFLFGTSIAYFNKNTSAWEWFEFKSKSDTATLPWMNAELNLIRHETNYVPFKFPESVLPIQKNGQLIKGDMRSVYFEVLTKKYWVNSSAPLNLLIKGKRVVVEVTKESVTLPFELTLKKFKMDTDPGTNNPASYESFVALFDGVSNETKHIFMNNPFKKDGYTFYQASYADDGAGNYSSVLAVNVDQGRILKYLGSLMLVLGSIWHFYLNKKKTQTT